MTEAPAPIILPGQNASLVLSDDESGVVVRSTDINSRLHPPVFISEAALEAALVLLAPAI